MSTVVVNIVTFFAVMLVGQIAVNVSSDHTMTFNYGFFTMIVMVLGLFFGAAAACIDQEQLEQKLKAAEQELERVKRDYNVPKTDDGQFRRSGTGDLTDQRRGKTTLRDRLESQRDRRTGKG